LKISLFISVLLVLIITPAFGALSDATGLVNRLDVVAGGYTLEVKVVSNFNVIDHEFDKDEKRLTIFIDSGLENNLGEIIIPKLLLDGNFTFYLNDIPLNQKIKSNDLISFITLNFTGVGNNKIDIFATKTITSVEKPETLVIDESQSEGGGCLIATATYGTELAPQVQQLREIRDQKLINTEFGQSFLNSFNEFYYSVSPYIADYERENLVFKEIVKISITPMISSLSILNYVDMNSEVQVLGYGISLILLNLGMYIGIPAVVVVGIRKKF
jgi:hypothetical protein